MIAFALSKTIPGDINVMQSPQKIFLQKRHSGEQTRFIRCLLSDSAANGHAGLTCANASVAIFCQWSGEVLFRRRASCFGKDDRTKRAYTDVFSCRYATVHDRHSHQYELSSERQFHAESFHHSLDVKGWALLDRVRWIIVTTKNQLFIDHSRVHS